MKTCDYCGKGNEDVTQFCAGCGTAFQDPEVKTEPAPWTKLRGQLHVLNAVSATVILFAYFFSAVLGAFFRSSLTDLIFSTVLSGIGMVGASIYLIPKFLKDTSPTGAAWVLGPWKAILKGLIIGLVLGACAHILVLTSKFPVARKNTDFLNQLIHTPGIIQWITFVATALLVPPIEEMLFRGVLYGGYRKSFGSFWGAALPTLLFVAGHLPACIDVPTYVIPITGLAFATLWCRLRWSAIGPAIAIHIAYNAVLGLLAIYRI